MQRAKGRGLTHCMQHAIAWQAVAAAAICGHPGFEPDLSKQNFKNDLFEAFSPLGKGWDKICSFYIIKIQY